MTTAWHTLFNLVRRKQEMIDDFNEWKDEWAYSCPRTQEESEEETALYTKMMREENPHLRKWRLHGPGRWAAPEVLPFCDKCQLWHGQVSWCTARERSE